MSNAIEHVVRWWLTDPDDAEARARSREAVQKLAGVPGVMRLSIGTPTEVTWTGPDQTWDLAFVISFDSYEAVEGYLAHPVHDEVVKLAGELAGRVDVFYVDA